MSALERSDLAALHQTAGISGRSGRRTVAKLLRNQARSADHDEAVRLGALVTAGVLKEDLQWDEADQSAASEYIREEVARWGPTLVVLALHVLTDLGDLPSTTRNQLERVAKNTGAASALLQAPPDEPSRSPRPHAALRSIVRSYIRRSCPASAGNCTVDTSAAIDYLLDVDPECSSWHYLAGLNADDPIEAADLSAGRAEVEVAFLAGRLERVGWTDRRAMKTFLEERIDPGTVLRLAAAPEAENLVSDLIEVASQDLSRVRDLIEVIPGPFRGASRLVDDALDVASSDPSRTGSEALLRSLESAIARWAVVGDSELRNRIPEITVARVRCRRSRGDFAGARRLIADLTKRFPSSLTDDAVAMEHAFAIAEVRDAMDVLFPQTESDLVRVVSRFAPARSELIRVLDSQPDNSLAHLILGLLLHCEEDVDAATHLTTALSLYESQGADPEFVARLRFVSGLAQLRRYEPATVAGAYMQIATSLSEGYVPSGHEVASAVEALELHDSPYLGQFLRGLNGCVPSYPELVAAARTRAEAGDEHCIAVIEALGTDLSVSVATRSTLLFSALTGADKTCDAARATRLVHALDDCLVRNASEVLDLEFASVLAEFEVVRAALGHHTDFLRIEVLRRVGHLDEARTMARQLFYRAAAGALPGEFDAVNMLLLLRELGVDEDELATLERVVPGRPVDEASSRSSLSAPIRVVFVGGDEHQRRYIPALNAELLAQHGGEVSVEWFTTGWRSNWVSDVEKIKASLDKADALVVMTFTRTHLGQLLRTEAGERGLPWVSCTGHGRAALLRSIEHAVQVVVELRQSRQD